MTKDKLQSTIRSQLSILHEPGPLTEGAIKSILATCEEYAKSHADAKDENALFSSAAPVALPPGARGLINGIRADLEPAFKLARTRT